MEPLLVILGVFLFVFGACVGSFLNVVIWRLPYKLMGAEVTYKGKTGRLTLSWPPSHCPHCDATIPWFLNIPVLGWCILAGRCVKCRKPIALRYPIVELATGLLFLVTFLAYASGLRTGWVSIHHDWAVLALHLVFIAALLAAAAIDADTYTIPLSLPSLVSVLAIASAPFIDSKLIPHLDKVFWNWANPILGAAAGLIVANVLLYLKVLPLSFAMPATDEAEEKDGGDKKKKDESSERIDAPPAITKKLPVVMTTIIAIAAMAIAWAIAPAKWAAVVSVVAGIIVFLVGVLSRDADTPDATDEVMEEISAAGARKEILKEILFLLFPIVGALVATTLPSPAVSPWLGRLLGVMLGFMVGGGCIWAIRVLGTLWKGIEAMGLGDVHLMAAAGAVLGPVLVLVAFPLFSPILALGWAGFRWATHRHTILPFGPWLAIASIIALLCGEPVVTWYLNIVAP